jgi:hypothetical protein
MQHLYHEPIYATCTPRARKMSPTLGRRLGKSLRDPRGDTVPSNASGSTLAEWSARTSQDVRRRRKPANIPPRHLHRRLRNTRLSSALSSSTRRFGSCPQRAAASHDAVMTPEYLSRPSVTTDFCANLHRLPLLQRISKSPTFITHASFIGVAGTKLPAWCGSWICKPPQSSWKSSVIVLQSVCAGILATLSLSRSAAAMGG